MRVEPSDVLLRLEPSACIIDRATGATSYIPVVELHWKDGRKWRHKTFTGKATLGGILNDLGQWLDAAPDLDAALAELGGARTTEKP